MKALSVCGLLLPALSAAVNEPLTLSATPVQSVTPYIRIGAAFEPDSANRMLTIIADGDGMHRSSEIPLNLENRPTIAEVIFLDMPGGRYDVSASLVDASGHRRAVVHSTEVVARFRRPPTIVPNYALTRNHLRFRISPEMTIAIGTTVLGAGEALTGEPIEMIATHRPAHGELNAYERVLHDAISGDATLFAREDYVEEAWRIVDPLLKRELPIHEYAIGTWGPADVDRLVRPAGGWYNPALSSDAQMTAMILKSA